MDLLYPNYVNTTTQFTFATGGSDNIANVMLLDDRYQWVSSGLNSDIAATLVIVSFNETVAVDRIALKGINWKQFTIFYNGGSNYFTLNNGTTTAVMFSSESAHYFAVTQVYCTSVTFALSSTQVADQEKTLGYVAIGRALSTFGGRVPSAQKYRPTYRTKKAVHELSDGSYRSQIFDRKLGCDIQLDFVTTATRNELKTAFESNSDFIFCPFGTMTGWDQVIFPCIWANDFEFFEVTDNNAAGGHSGAIKFLETKP